MRYIPLIVQFDFEHTNIVVDIFFYSPLLIVYVPSYL